MARLLSPEHSLRELEGDLQLEEVAQALEKDSREDVESYDLIYEKDRESSSGGQGSSYRLKELNSNWYDEETLEDVKLDDLEIDVHEVRMNAVTGETVLVDSEGEETRYDIHSSFEGTTTFTQQLGLNEYVFRYDRKTDTVKAVEIGSSSEPTEWGSNELRKRTKLMDHFYHETRGRLWKDRRNQEINTDSKFKRLLPTYKRVRERIDEHGRCTITPYTHIGSARGGDIKKNFKKAVKRAPGDSLDNYQIDNDGNGNYPIEISRDDE